MALAVVAELKFGDLADVQHEYFDLINANPNPALVLQDIQDPNVVRKDHIERILAKDPFNDSPNLAAKQTRGEIHTNENWQYYKVSVFFSYKRGAKMIHPVMISRADPTDDRFFVVELFADRVHPEFPRANLTLISLYDAVLLTKIGLVQYVMHTVQKQTNP